MISVEDRAFRDALGRFASGVTVVTTEHEGVLHATTISAFTSVSLRPPQILICVDHANRFHRAVIASGRWGVSILSEGNEPASSQLATRGRDLDTQFDRIPHHRGRAGTVLVDDALAWLECRTAQTFESGDHSIVVGEVVAADIDATRDDPLLYYRSHYGSLVRSARNERGPS